CPVQVEKRVRAGAGKTNSLQSGSGNADAVRIGSTAGQRINLDVNKAGHTGVYRLGRSTNPKTRVGGVWWHRHAQAEEHSTQPLGRSPHSNHVLTPLSKMWFQEARPRDSPEVAHKTHDAVTAVCRAFLRHVRPIRTCANAHCQEKIHKKEVFLCLASSFSKLIVTPIKGGDYLAIEDRLDY